MRHKKISRSEKHTEYIEVKMNGMYSGVRYGTPACIFFFFFFCPVVHTVTVTRALVQVQPVSRTTLYILCTYKVASVFQLGSVTLLG